MLWWGWWYTCWLLSLLKWSRSLPCWLGFDESQLPRELLPDEWEWRGAAV
jgi:hypothetical protein